MNDNLWTNLWLAIIAFTLLAFASDTEKSIRIENTKTVYVKQNPYYDYCITVGSDGKHPDATEFCKDILK